MKSDLFGQLFNYEYMEMNKNYLQFSTCVLNQKIGQLEIGSEAEWILVNLENSEMKIIVNENTKVVVNLCLTIGME